MDNFWGGERIIECILGFEAMTNGVSHVEQMKFGAVFYEADIHVDAILSFPWMVEHKIAVFPHKRALAIDFPVLTLLFGLPDSTQRKKYISTVQNLENATVCTESNISGPPGGSPIGQHGGRADTNQCW